MTHRRTYKAGSVDASRLIHALVAWYRSEGYESHLMEPPSGEGVIQVRQSEVWRSVLGVSSALNVTLSVGQGTLTVDIRVGKRVDKALAGAVGVFLLWALFFTAAHTRWLRAQVPERTFAFIEHFIATGEPW